MRDQEKSDTRTKYIFSRDMRQCCQSLKFHLPRCPSAFTSCAVVLCPGDPSSPRRGKQSCHAGFVDPRIDEVENRLENSYQVSRAILRWSSLNLPSQLLRRKAGVSLILLCKRQDFRNKVIRKP